MPFHAPVSSTQATHPEQRDEVFLVRRLSSSGGGVLPVEVEPVEVVLFAEVHHAVHKHPPARRVLSHGRVLHRSFVPAADGDQSLQLRVQLLQTREPLEGSCVTQV